MSEQKTDDAFAWEILNLIFRDGDFYIDTGFQHPEFNDGKIRTRLCIDGTDYTITDEQVAWLEQKFWPGEPTP